MLVKLFVLGHPGSGKSTVSRYIERYTKQKYADYWSTSRINDYSILSDMSKHDTKHKRFQLTEHEGFIVHDLQKYNQALKKLERKALKKVKETQVSSPSQKKLLVIEFARKNYHEALENFNASFLQDAYFVFLDVDIQTCINRVHHRINNQRSPDDHFVHESILESYRDLYPRYYINSNLAVDFSLPKDRIIIINNNGAEEDFEDQMNRFIDFIFEQASGNVFATSP
jgi:adenylate kinase family enzyme